MTASGGTSANYFDKNGKTKLGERVIKVNLPSIEDFAIYLNVNKTTIYEWMSNHKDFSNAIDLDLSRIKVKDENKSLPASVIKVLFYLNTTSPLLFGDKILNKARSILVREISAMSTQADPVPLDLIMPLVDFSDLDYLDSRHNIRFADQEKPLTKDRRDLVDWLLHIDVDILDKIRDWLSVDMNKACKYTESSDLIHRFFYSCLIKASKP